MRRRPANLTLAYAWLVVCAACAHPSPVSEARDISPIASASSAAVSKPDPASADAGVRTNVPIVAWTDPGAVAGLTQSCSFAPTTESKDRFMGRHDPLACRMSFEQACVVDPCIQDSQEQCAHECEGTCDSCAKTCVKSCDACKAECHDEACKRTCAESCGNCRQSCVTAIDRCASSRCAEIDQACRKSAVKDWLAGGCDAICTQTKRCSDHCEHHLRASEDIGDCMSKCDVTVTRNGKTCNPAFCDSMLNASERKELDPKWKANHCSDVCAKVWECAKKSCNDNAADCIEPEKKYDSCADRTAGAVTCGLKTAPLLCPLPEQREEEPAQDH